MGTSQTSCEDVPAHPSSRLPKGNKEFYVLAAGLARRTYSSYRPPDAISVRLFRFMFRFCSKTVPERGGRTLRRRPGECPVALQVLPENAGYSMVRFVTLAAVTNPTSACSALHGNFKERVMRVYSKADTSVSVLLCLYILSSCVSCVSASFYSRHVSFYLTSL